MAPDPHAAAGGGAQPSKAYVNYVLVILTLVFVMNLADRQIMSIVAEPVKLEMKLSDAQLGLLTGPATALLYAFLALPMAYLADRVNRVRFLAVCCGLWSVITALGGLSSNVWQLGVTRLGVSIAEAGGSPASLSLISDHFARGRRATALAVWSSATSIGVFVGFALGGVANDLVGWRGAFVVAGIPGILLTVVILLTLREPVRGAADALPPPPPETRKTPIWRDVTALLRIRVIRGTYMAAALSNISIFAVYAWGPSFAQRSYAVSTSKVGLLMGVGIAVAGTIFGIFAGIMIDRLNKRSVAAPMKLIAATQLAAAPLMALAFLSPNFLGFAILLPLGFGLAMTYGPLNLTVAQSYAPPWRRAMAAAMTSLILSLVGPGLSVPLIGFLSDRLAGAYGPESLRHALLLIVPASLVCASVAFLWVARAARHEPILQDSALEGGPITKPAPG